MIYRYSATFLRIAKEKNQHRGFSLIELLVVLVLMSAISGLVAPNFWNLFTKTMEQQDLFAFTEKLEALRLDAWRTGRAIRLTKDGGPAWPPLPEGWSAYQLPALHFLSTGITNGGRIILSSHTNNHWQIDIAALDGRITLTPLDALPKAHE
ncbi:MAG: prepilin-type N-terminal cleavage/methylation domain-containing protein [Methylococcales bacterium]